MNAYITFSSKKKEYNSLSNFWMCYIVIKNADEEIAYESGEHCFHGEKYRRIAMLYCESSLRRTVLLNYSKRFRKDYKYSENSSIIGSYFMSPNDAKNGGGKRGLLLSDSELDEWKSISIDVQKKICLYKFENYKEVKDDLRKSGTKILIHPAMRCSDDKMNKKIWEGRMKENGEILGKNLLGNFWMELRGAEEA